MHRVILAICIHDGEQFLKSTLEGLLSTIKDISVVYLLDGAWEQGGKTAVSTDKSWEIFEEMRAKYGEDIEFVWEEPPITAGGHGFWKNPSEKRNHQLKQIEEMYGYESYSIIWFDDDEELRFASGLTEIWLRDILKQTGRPIVIPTFGHGSDIRMNTVRIISKGYHWHTEKAMVLHDSKCETILDWNLGSWQNLVISDIRQPPKVEFWAGIFIVNKWPLRNRETQEKRINFFNYEQESLKHAGECLFLKSA